MKEMIQQYLTKNNDAIWGISQHLFRFPELSGQEHASCAYLKEQLHHYGFQVSSPYPSLPTAFLATYGNHPHKPTVAFLAEYDALPGFGENGAPAHACGHNWIAASACGAAMALASLDQNCPVNVVVLGTPAEETTGAKVDLVKLNAFSAIDLVIQCHPEAETLLYPGALAMDAIQFAFKGKSAHAAQYPHHGINALDAVQLTFAGINALRQHVTPDVRIHGIVSQGGLAPNIVPSDASCHFYVRAHQRKTVNRVTEKVLNCAKGAELMTGATLTHSFFENPFDELVLINELQTCFAENLKCVGIEEINLEPEALPGSSDIGNVSYVVPTLYANIKVSSGPTVHEADFLGEITSAFSKAQLERTILAMAYTSIDVALKPNLLEGIKKVHHEMTTLDLI